MKLRDKIEIFLLVVLAVMNAVFVVQAEKRLRGLDKKLDIHHGNF